MKVNIEGRSLIDEPGKGINKQNSKLVFAGNIFFSARLFRKHSQATSWLETT